jgi:outer membrane immunogenic protein
MGTHSMKFSRVLALSSVALLALGQAAFAQNQDRWTALYWGANGGYAFGDSDWDFGGTTTNPDLEGELFGLHVGYQQNLGGVVLGVEGSYDWANLEGDATCPNPLANCSNSINDLITAGLRLGLDADPALIYATAGFAYASVESRVFFPAAPLSDEAGDDWHGGWFAGAGVDFLLNRDVMLGVEYLYLDLQDQDHSLNNISTGAFVETANIDPQNHVIRVRLAAKVVGLFED